VGSWRPWRAGSTYTRRWRESVQRSAITLELRTCAPTGGLVAAPTAALPEQIGGERNWDYRYPWVRDASFPVHAGPVRDGCGRRHHAHRVGGPGAVGLAEKVQGDISGVARSASNLGSSPGVAIAGSLIAGASASFGKPFALAIVVLGIFAMVGWVAPLLIPRSAPREAGAEGAPA
jgi:hypothetical protein